MLIGFVLTNNALMWVGDGTNEADMATGMGFVKLQKVRGVGGDIQWTDPLLVNCGAQQCTPSSFVYSYVGSRLDALSNGNGWIKWGWRKGHTHTFRLRLEYEDISGNITKVGVVAPIPVFATSQNYDFHYNASPNFGHLFFVNHNYVVFAPRGLGPNQIPFWMGDIAFAGTDVALYHTEHLRNPPNPNPLSQYDCSVYFSNLKWYKPTATDPNVFKWKDWKTIALDAYFLSVNGSDDYRSDSLTNTSFYTWNIGGDYNDPCGNAGDS